jgi:hypothetical protein
MQKQNQPKLVIKREEENGQSVRYFATLFGSNLFGLLNKTGFELDSKHKLHLVQQLIKTLNLLTMLSKDDELYRQLASFLLSFQRNYYGFKDEIRNGIRILVQSTWSQQMDPLMIQVMAFANSLDQWN